MTEISAPTSQRSAGHQDLAGLDPRFIFDSFIVGKPNELAFAAAQRVAESETAAFNPLFLYGGVGLGKTHLMHAIAWEIRARHRIVRSCISLLRNLCINLSVLCATEIQ